MVDLRGSSIIKAVHDDGSNYFIIKTKQGENQEIKLRTLTAEGYKEWAVVLIESCMTDQKFKEYRTAPLIVQE
jgi:hypothetical protein